MMRDSTTSLVQPQNRALPVSYSTGIFWLRNVGKWRYRLRDANLAISTIDFGTFHVSYHFLAHHLKCSTPIYPSCSLTQIPGVKLAMKPLGVHNGLWTISLPKRELDSLWSLRNSTSPAINQLLTPPGGMRMSLPAWLVTWFSKLLFISNKPPRLRMSIIIQAMRLSSFEGMSLSFSTPAEIFDIGVAVVIHPDDGYASTPTHLYILFWHYMRQKWSLVPERKVFRAPVSYNTQIDNLVTYAPPFISQMGVWSKLISHLLDRCLYLSFWTPSGNL